MIKRLIAITLLAQVSIIKASEELPLFDTHVHHNERTQKTYNDEKVLTLLQEYGVKKALVSSTGDHNTQRLKAQAPNLILPSLKPYRTSADLRSWMHDPTVIDHLESAIKSHNYLAIGEFHAFGEEMKTPVAVRLVELAKEYGLVLHLHGDREAMQTIYTLWPEAKVLWAHAGFEDPSELAALFEQHDTLWADLSFRPEILTWGGFNPEWEQALRANPDRFTLGSDTFNEDQWKKMPLYTLDTRTWLAELPKEMAEQIAYKNAERLFGFKINDALTP